MAQKTHKCDIVVFWAASSEAGSLELESKVSHFWIFLYTGEIKIKT